ncbi:toprim domain-containing protein [Lapillicoccus jejuensis]|uniref:toprim domain-containing protein n=1 Tax=Lapillicoccus jejuensis TaxID=402171 RepID=UPI003CCC7EBB
MDVFRDRLVLPIQAAIPRHLQHLGSSQPQVVGFVGRRHPEHDRLESGTDGAIKAGPKYLNTGETVLFAKGDQLYGLAEHADRLAGGATPVIVEGPIDALAVTLASPGSSGQQGHVGLAQLGTALTDTQTDSLLPYLQTNAHQNGTTPVVATDADRAGQAAAAKDYWILTARGADPTHLNLPAGHDPASLLRAEGTAALADRLTHSTRPLAGILIEERLNTLPPAEALPQAAAVIAASHPTTWRRRATVVADRLHMPVTVAVTELVTHAGRWDSDRHQALQTQLQHTRDLATRPAEPRELPATHLWHHWHGRSTPPSSATRRGPNWPNRAPTPPPPATTSRPYSKRFVPQSPSKPKVSAGTGAPGSSPTSTPPRPHTSPHSKPTPRGLKAQAAVRSRTSLAGHGRRRRARPQRHGTSPPTDSDDLFTRCLSDERCN